MKRIKVNRAALFAIITSVGEFGLALSRYCDLSIISYMVFGVTTVYGAYNFACECLNCADGQLTKQDKPLSESVRQIKIKPQRPAYITMIKNEYADEAEPQNSRYIKIGI